MERASHAALGAERSMLGRSGAMERGGVAPLAPLPTRCDFAWRAAHALVERD
jgi:hypothetical protein